MADAGTCKNCGADSGELDERGPYAKLCPDCKESKRSERAGRVRMAPTEDSFEARARTLVSYGRRLDKAIADVRLTALREREAKELAVRAMREWKDACLRLANSGAGGGHAG